MATTGDPIGAGVFDIWARFYDLPLMQQFLYRSIHDEVVGVVRDHSPARVLDVGCGTGQLAERLDRTVDDPVVGVDFSAGMLAQAAVRSRSVHWVQGDAMRLPVASASVDIITCTESFHWYGDQPGALGEFHRVLRPRGRALVALLSPPVDAVPGLDRLRLPFLGSARWPSPRRLRQLFLDADLEVEDQRRILRVPGLPVPAALLTIGRRPAT